MRITLTPPDWAVAVLSDLTDWNQRPLPLADLAPLELPDDVYFEYAFYDAAGEKRADPANAEKHNPWYPHARSIYGPTYARSAYNLDDHADPAGDVERTGIESAILGKKRRVLRFTPAGFEGQRLPTIYCQDGTAMVHFARLPATVERLIADGKMRPAHIVFIPPEDREAEYPFSDAYQRFVLEELLPWSEASLPCTGERVAMGASLGGLVSTLLAWRAPEVFGTVAVLSPAYLTTPEAPRDHHYGREWFLEQVRSGSKRDLRFVLFAGRLEWLCEASRNVRDALRREGYPVHHFEANCGHNWVGWRDAIGQLLAHALPADAP